MLENKLLWRLEAYGNRGYVFGTAHIRDHRVLAIAEEVFPYIDDCTQFASEFPLDQSSAAVPEAVPFSERPSQVLSPKQYRRLSNMLLKAGGIELKRVEHLPPLFIVQMLSEVFMSNGAPDILDKYLWDYAMLQGKTGKGVETLEDQMKYMAAIPVRDQLRQLRKVVKNTSSFRKQLIATIDLYFERDVQRLYKRTKRSLGKQRQLLLYYRNGKMVDRLDDLLQIGSVFACVGAAHLPGEKGVLRGLKKRNVSVSGVL